MRNISSVISSHNKVITNKLQTQEKMCNCRNKSQCPLDNLCLTSKIIYQAEVTNDKNDDKKTYIGLTENTFKQRHSNHVKSFNHKKYAKETELPNYIWDLKDNNKQPSIRWKILKTIKSRLSPKQCILCLSEKFFIIKNLDDVNLLNKRSEFISKCRHMNKHMLQSVKDSKD